MPLLDQIRFDKLLELARARFDQNLTDAEIRVVRESASSVDATEPAKAAARPDVRSEFVRWLATDPEAAPHIDPKGLRVWGATLPNKLDFEECHLLSTLYLHRCTIPGEINLMSVEAKDIYITESDVAGRVQADGLTVHGPVSFRGSTFASEVRMLGATIQSELSLTSAKFNHPGDALSLDNANVGNNVFLNGEFESVGTVRMLGIQVSGNVECDNAKLKGTPNALILDEARIGGGVFCRNGLESVGAIRLPVAEIKGDVEFWDVDVAEVSGRNLRLTGDLIWMLIHKPQRAVLKLIGANVRVLRDSPKSRPAAGNLKLDGLQYDDLVSHKEPMAEDLANNRLPDENKLDANDRIDWLMLQHENTKAKAQPWMQLRALLDKKGDDRGSKHVLYKFRCFQAGQKPRLARSARIAFAWLEEIPSRILWLVGVTLLLFTSLFWYAGASGALAPTEAEAYKAFTHGKPMPAAYPQLNPFVYTVDNALPLAKLGQDDKWAPDHRYPSTNLLTSYWFLMWARWILLIWGWFQAAVLGAAIVSRFKS
jgi:hypothetical protein